MTLGPEARHATHGHGHARFLIGLIGFLLLFAGVAIFMGGEGRALKQSEACYASAPVLMRRLCGIAIACMVLGFISCLIILIELFRPNKYIWFVLTGPFVVTCAFMGQFVVSYGLVIDASADNAAVDAAFAGALLWYLGTGVYLCRYAFHDTLIETVVYQSQKNVVPVATHGMQTSAVIAPVQQVQPVAQEIGAIPVTMVKSPWPASNPTINGNMYSPWPHASNPSPHVSQQEMIELKPLQVITMTNSPQGDTTIVIKRQDSHMQFIPSTQNVPGAEHANIVMSNSRHQSESLSRNTSQARPTNHINDDMSLHMTEDLERVKQEHSLV